MPFSVQAYIDDHRLSVTTETAKDAFAKAVEWHVTEGLSNITISDGNKSYTVSEFSSVMALQQIADTVEADVVRECDNCPQNREATLDRRGITKDQDGLPQRAQRSPDSSAYQSTRSIGEEQGARVRLVPLKKSESW
jgi:hypothetical protein